MWDIFPESFKKKLIKKVVTFVQPYVECVVNVYGRFFHVGNKISLAIAMA